jgi:hypothetical protein
MKNRKKMKNKKPMEIKDFHHPRKGKNVSRVRDSVMRWVLSGN